MRSRALSKGGTALRTQYYDAIIAMIDTMLHEEGRTPRVIVLRPLQAAEIERELGMTKGQLWVLNGSLIMVKK